MRIGNSRSSYKSNAYNAADMNIPRYSLARDSLSHKKLEYLFRSSLILQHIN
jgi:hypothetical protein